MRDFTAVKMILILLRRDVDEHVRKAAFKFIAEKIHIKSLTIAQREQILQRGLSDRSDGVKSIVERELIPAWLRLCKDTVALMYALDVGNSDGKVAVDVLNVLFKNVPYKELVQNFRSVIGQIMSQIRITNNHFCGGMNS